MKKACVIGWPIAHSRSPLIHGYWLAKHGIEGSYTRVPVAPADLETFITSLPANGYAGCNVTIPHKEAAFRLITPADGMTRKLAVTNTIYVRNGRLFGTSTDGEGFLASLVAATSYQPAAAPAMVVGAGGAATSVVGSLVDAGTPRIYVANRTAARAEQLQRQFGAAVVPVKMEDAPARLRDCQLLVNTTSLGMTGYGEFELPIDGLPRDAVVYDIVYVPLETELLRNARARGHRTVGGLGMLLHQAVRGFELWFGVRPEVTNELYDLVAADVKGASVR
jgi:shikimate dehydrogenase